MKYLTLAFIFISIHSYAQITGNPHVKDSNAITLNEKAVSDLLGKWKLLRSEELQDGEKQVKERGIIIDFSEGGEFTSSWCVGCYLENAGQWEVIKEQTINFEGMQPELKKYLAGEWAVYKLTDAELILARVLTSTGSWKKLHYFSKDVGDPPTTKVNRYCINCMAEGNWCWGDRPEEAQQQWIVLIDMIDIDRESLQNSHEVFKRIDWMLQNAPCIDDQLYMQAIGYYESLLKIEKNNENIAQYSNDLEQIKKQRAMYFNK